jgi:hypothetical protein
LKCIFPHLQNSHPDFNTPMGKRAQDPIF